MNKGARERDNVRARASDTCEAMTERSRSRAAPEGEVAGRVCETGMSERAGPRAAGGVCEVAWRVRTSCSQIYKS
jgi:hypothetical protein